MWIYFLEQVWGYNPDEWPRMNWWTREYQTRFWEHWHYHEYPDGTHAYSTMTIYENQDHLVEGNDYISY